MKQSARAMRLARHHKRVKNSGKLNLVSLMDIFTILVFFLIVNQSEVQVLQNSKKLTLPVSVAEQMPRENIVVAVYKDNVLVQDRPIWQRDKSNPTPILDETEIEQLILALKTELNYQKAKRVELTEREKEKGRAVTILGDSSIEYDLLKQIMASCAEVDYRDMSLAVKQVARDKAGVR